MLGVAEVDQRIEAGNRLEDDVAALAALAAVGAAIFDELLAPEADRARPAGAGADEDLGLVEKMHGRAISDKCGDCVAQSVGGSVWAPRARTRLRKMASTAMAVTRAPVMLTVELRL